MTTYRYWGKLDPRGRTKPAIRAEQTATVDDNVATLRLFDPIDSWGGEWGVSAKEFVSVLDELGDVDRIDLLINSPGGEVFDALAIMNALRRHPAPITATVDGIAASAASFIAASADSLTMSRNSEMMIHDGHGLCLGNAADMRKLADTLDRLSDNIASVYAEKSGGDVESWRELMRAETWFSADEAVSAGLADRVDRPKDDNAKNRWDLAALFDHPNPSAAIVEEFPIAEKAPTTAPLALYQRRLAAREKAFSR